MPRRKFKKYTKEEQKKLGLYKMPDTMYDTGTCNMQTPEREELPISYEDIEDEEELLSD